MAVSGWLHWGEGLFLQPHHFQVLQRRFVEQAATDRSLAMHFPYGVISASLFVEGLAKGIVKFDRLRAVMKSGTVVDYPSGAELPPLNVSAALASSEPFVVMLAVPLWDGARPNAATNGIASRSHFTTADTDINDENTGENPQRITMRRVSARLVLQWDNHAGMEIIPILRVIPGAEPGVGVEDRRFIPPCLLVTAWPGLSDMVERITARIEAKRNEMALSLQQSGATAEIFKSNIAQIFRLTILNKYAARLGTLIKIPSFTPIEAYLELRTLLGELAALHPDRDLYPAPDYFHDDPAIAFSEFERLIPPLIVGGEKPVFTSAPFVNDGRVRVCTADSQQLLGAQRLYLAVKSKQDASRVAETVENRRRFKLMSRRKAFEAYPGLKLREERLPDGLPPSHDVRYFMIETNADQDSIDMWKAVTSELSIAAKWPDMETSDFDLTLYMVQPAAVRAAGANS